VNDFKKELKAFARKKQAISAREARKELGIIMDEAAGVLRMAGRLDLALERIEQLKERNICAAAKDIPSAVEARGALTVAEAVIRAARMRKESRGGHVYFIHDKPLPRNDRKWRKYIVISKTKKGMALQALKPKGPGK
jgi:succinate dehydrogenase/fumarate reductase flavoprotein subunit